MCDSFRYFIYLMRATTVTVLVVVAVYGDSTGTSIINDNDNTSDNTICDN